MIRRYKPKPRQYKNLHPQALAMAATRPGELLIITDQTAQNAARKHLNAARKLARRYISIQKSGPIMMVRSFDLPPPPS